MIIIAKCAAVNRFAAASLLYEKDNVQITDDLMLVPTDEWRNFSNGQQRPVWALVMEWKTGCSICRSQHTLQVVQGSLLCRPCATVVEAKPPRRPAK